MLSHYQTQEERETQFSAFLRAADTAVTFVQEGVQAAMQACNAKS